MYAPDLTARSANSLKKLISDSGLWDPTSPALSAMKYLASLHAAGSYDKRSILRLQGGKFDRVRALVFKTSAPVHFDEPRPVSSFRTRRSRCAKPSAYELVTPKVVDDGNWPEMAKRILSSGVSNRSREELGRHLTKREIAQFKKRYKAVEGYHVDRLHTFHTVGKHLGWTELKITAALMRLWQHLTPRHQLCGIG